MKQVTFSCLTLATLLQLIPSNGNAANIQVNKKKTNRTEMKQDTIPANSTKKESEEGERNVMLNASDANKPREIQIGLPSEDVNVYENGLPALYSSTVHKLAAHWRSDSSLGEVGLLSPSESAITTGNIAYSVNSFSKLGQKDIDAHSTIVKFCNRQAFRVAMTVQIKCQHHISPASQLNTIQVLHFFVVIPSFDCNNTRRRCVFGCILWNVKVCGQLVSRGTFPAHFLDPDPTRSLYSGRYDGTYKAKNQ